MRWKRFREGREREESFSLSETKLSLAPGAAHSIEMKPVIVKGEGGKAEDERSSIPESYSSLSERSCFFLLLLY